MIQDCGKSHRHKLLEFHVNSIRDGLKEGPGTFPIADYAIVNADCLSIGRSPIVNGTIHASIIYEEQPGITSKPLDISIGSIATDNILHLRVSFLESAFAKMKVFGESEAHHDDDTKLTAHPQNTEPKLSRQFAPPALLETIQAVDELASETVKPETAG